MFRKIVENHNATNTPETLGLDNQKNSGFGLTTPNSVFLL